MPLFHSSYDAGHAIGAAFDFIPHKRVEHVSPSPSGKKPSEVVAQIGDHFLIRTWRGTFYDKAPAPHGWRFLGNRLTDEEAREKWRDRLRSEGVI